MTPDIQDVTAVAVPDLSIPIPQAPDGMAYLVRTHWQITLPEYDHAHTQERWHATLDPAISEGMHACCVNACRWVTVHAADGTLESTWRYADENGQYDNQWRDVGPGASARRAVHLAEINEQIRANLRHGRTQTPLT